MMEDLVEGQGPSLIKKWWNPKSFSNRTVEAEKLHITDGGCKGDTIL